MTISEVTKTLKKTDLIYIRPNHKIASLIGVPQHQKERQIIKKESYFVSNLKVLRSLYKKTDPRSVKTVEKSTEMCVSLLEDICKLRKAAELDNEKLKEHEEFKEYEENQAKDLAQFLNKNLQRYSNYYDFTKDNFEDLVRRYEEEIGEAYLCLLEDTKDKKEVLRLLRPTIEGFGLTIKEVG
jgi:transcriptional regulator of heat shock response